MRRLDLHSAPVAAFGSRGVAACAVMRVDDVDGAGVDVLAFGPGALLGRHPTRLWQLFTLVSGPGWVSGPDGVREPLAAGEAVLWEPGEEHESGTDHGMVAVVVQTPTPPLPGMA